MIDYSQDEIGMISNQRLAAEIDALKNEIRQRKFEIDKLEVQYWSLIDELGSREAGATAA